MARATARRSDRPTARNAARRGFRGLDDRLQLVIEAADLAFWDWDVASGRVDWGGHRFGLLERRPRASEATYEAFLRLVHADDRQALSDAIARAFEKGETFR